MPNSTKQSSQPWLSPEEVRQLLERRRAQFLGRIDTDAAPADASRATVEPRGPGDAGDRALRDLAEEDRLNDAQRASSRLKLIDAARARLSAGTYGLCTDCDERIEARRLRSIPEVMRCVNCQEIYDRDHHSGERHATL